LLFKNLTIHQCGCSGAHSIHHNSIGHFKFVGLNAHWLFERNGLLSTTRGLKVWKTRGSEIDLDYAERL
jgi:hypothetical protein